jgi:DNA-binding beta-propeller fold protein YncE
MRPVRDVSIAMTLCLAVAAPGAFAGHTPNAATKDTTIAVANEHATSLQFFDLNTGKLLKDIPTLRRPHEMVIDPATGLAYVSIAYQDGPFSAYEKPGNQIQVIDLQNMAITNTIDITPHWAPHGLAFDAKDGILYASCESNGGELIGVDIKQMKVVSAVKLGVPHPHTVAVVPSLEKAYTANKDVQHISVVHLRSGEVSEIPAPTGTEGIIATADGRYVFASNQTGNDLLVIDPAKDVVVKRVSLDLPPSTFALAPDGSKLYITFWHMAAGTTFNDEGYIQELDIATLKPGPKLAVGHFPLNMTVASNGKIGVVDTTADGEIAVVDLAQMKITRKIKTDEWPHGILVY